MIATVNYHSSGSARGTGTWTLVKRYGRRVAKAAIAITRTHDVARSPRPCRTLRGQTPNFSQRVALRREAFRRSVSEALLLAVGDKLWFWQGGILNFFIFAFL